MPIFVDNFVHPYIASSHDNPINFAIENNQIVFITGKNGCGKSTLLSLMAKKNQGKEKNIASYGSLSFLGANNPFLNLLSLEEQWPFFGNQASLKNLDIPYSIPFGRLSKGQQRYACVFACLHKDASIYLLDEPFEHMDETYKNNSWLHIKDLAKKAIVVIAMPNLPSFIDPKDKQKVREIKIDQKFSESLCRSLH